MTCDCVAEVNKRLAFGNAIICTTVSVSPRVVIEIMKLDENKRGKLPKLVAACCPFCGERYPTD